MGKLRVYWLKTLKKLSIYPLGNTPSAPSGWNWRTNCCWRIWTAWWINCASAPGWRLLPRWLAPKFLMEEISDIILFRSTGPNLSSSMLMSLWIIHRTSRHMLSRVCLSRPRRSVLLMSQLWFRVRLLTPRSLVVLVARFSMSQ